MNMLTAAVATMLGISRTLVYDLARRGKLPSYRFGDAIRFEPADVQAFKEAEQGPSGSRRPRAHAYRAHDSRRPGEPGRVLPIGRHQAEAGTPNGPPTCEEDRAIIFSRASPDGGALVPCQSGRGFLTGLSARGADGQVREGRLCGAP